MSWLPDDFFLGHPGRPEARPGRPIGQGDVFLEVPVAGRTARRGDELGLKPKLETVIVVASSCGMRKTAGRINDVVHVAPIHRLSQLASSWSPPWIGYLQLLPLPGLQLGQEEEPAGANLGRIGLCGSDTLSIEKRVASVTRAGMQALKARLSGYFIRHEVPAELVLVGAFEEWNELDLWEHWVSKKGSEDGFQHWLDEINPNFSPRRRRETLYDDYLGIRAQIDEAG